MYTRITYQSPSLSSNPKLLIAQMLEQSPLRNSASDNFAILDRLEQSQARLEGPKEVLHMRTDSGDGAE